MQARGGQAEVAKALEAHSSSVKRWLEGESIPTQALKFLRLYLLGEDPFSGQGGGVDFQALLGFSAKEWLRIEIQAHRTGQKNQSGCGVRYWPFSHLVRTATQAEEWFRGRPPTPIRSHHLNSQQTACGKGEEP